MMASVVLCSWWNAISSDIDPGPASMGMASGVRAMSFRLWISSSISLLIPLFFLNCPFNKEKPELAIIKPPAIRKAGMVMPKKLSTYCPIKKEITRMIKTLSAVNKATRERSFWS